MKDGNLGDLYDRLSWVVDFNQGQTDQDFRGPASKPEKHLYNELNLAYRREVNDAKTYASEHEFKRRYPFTWTASATTMAIPAALKHQRILWASDDTDVSPGPVLRRWDESSDGSGWYDYDIDTWGWSPAPTSARSLTIVYLANPEWMELESDEPALIPRDYREMLVWSAAINMHSVAPITDQNTLQQWQMNHHNLRSAWWKGLARGKVAEFPPRRIRNPNGDINHLF